MTIEEKKLLLLDLCARLPYGVRGYGNKKYVELDGVQRDGGIYYWSGREDSENEYHPILRPMSQLTQEITQANYNGGKPFVPIMELFRLFSWCNISRIQNPSWQRSGAAIKIGFDYQFDFNRWPAVVVTQLREWHFSLDLPSNLWIDVAKLSTNPYAPA